MDGIAKGRVVVVTDDERGVAQNVAEVLQEQGQMAALVRMGEHTEVHRPGSVSDRPHYPYDGA